ncbi:MAG: HAMP domain-containing sensor histidine kinase [Chloroflexota bacterium]
MLRHLIADIWRPLAGLALGLVAVIAFCAVATSTPSADVQDLALFLAVSGSLSLIVGILVMYAAPSIGLGGLRARISLAHVVVIGVAFANIAMTAGLMFISSHDLGLLSLLLFFSGVVSVALASVIARQVASAASSLATAARAVASGRLDVRISTITNDEVGEVAHAFNAMAERLAEADQRRIEMEDSRRQLLAAVSHDLRTPLASLRAMVEAINDRVVTDQETIDRYLHSMGGEVSRLSSLIDDLFELSRLDSGQLALRREACSLADLLSDTVESMRLQAQRKDQRLTSHVDLDLPVVSVDVSRVQRAVSNLLQNAIRYTPPNGEIWLAAQRDRGEVRVDVVDSGDGITPSDLPRIFDRFYRGDKARVRGSEEAGAGLGLSIARGLIEAHGGRLWAENVPESGARFSFTLPLEPTAG